ncbi:MULTISPECIES: hypothetical protein [Streptomyces]|uniref:Uncharacterized protein n=1 Tax=Streptomyces gibsoniae TaxID=3075529 RepID=A0ABU2TT40_9ACTN|nr:hypothetical protein [Streptomyces sp. DSM 41699]MDT0464113.1 hypothetical protein [Streptomyces sp. DSM 41699]
MSETTPSQAEGERFPDETDAPDQPPRTTPSQAEGEDYDTEEEDTGATADDTRT